MTKSGLPYSTRKFLRREKARIRREVLSLEEQNRRIGELYIRFMPHLKHGTAGTRDASEEKVVLKKVPRKTQSTGTKAQTKRKTRRQKTNN